METKTATASGNPSVSTIGNFNSASAKIENVSTKPLSFAEQDSKTGAIERNLVDRNQIVGTGLKNDFTQKTATAFNYNNIQGVKGNKFVTAEFISSVEGMAARIGTRPEYIMGVMSFETGGTFDPAKRNGIGATGLIQFLPSTAEGLGTTTAKLANMSSTEQLKYVEKYFSQERYEGKLGTLEGLYTAVLSGTARQNSSDVLFRAGTKAYTQNPLDWNRDGNITAGEAVTPVAARMYGGVAAVQQRLIDGGFVPQEQLKNFADSAWGKNTSAALGRFQKANNLPETGLMDDKTGRALFGLQTPVEPPPNPPNTGILQQGSKGAKVESLQNNLIDLGFMTNEQKATGIGIFGPKTEAALKTFQDKAKLQVTGTFTPETEQAMKDITSALGNTRAVKNTSVTKGIQDRLVELGYMTQNQVNTGYGTFGRQTESAIKSFQAKNGVKETGLVGKLTYGKLFSANPNRGDAANGAGYSVATNGRNYTVNNGILMTDSLRPQLQILADRYFAATGSGLHITSGYRPPARQASAMYDLIQNNGTNYVQNLYANKTAVNEILNAYRNGGQPAMTRAIEGQVARGIYISDHLRSRALDVSTAANFGVLRTIVNGMGGSVLNEGNHFHIEL